jgi:DNA-binding transcriptional LysR family regulator
VLKHIDKIQTFLIVYKTKSFSKASKEMGVSQPAVTQQIKQLEEYLDISLIERKKSGIILTKEGKYFLEIANELKKIVDKIEIKVNQFKNKQFPFVLGATPTIGNYVLPTYLQYIQLLSNKDINLNIDNNKMLCEGVKSGDLDLAFTTKKFDDDSLVFTEWMEDELTVFSNQQIPSSLDFESLKKYQFVCKQENSSTREALKESFLDSGYDCRDLNIISTLNNSTAIKNMLLQSSNKLLSVISKNVIKDELKNKTLFATKIKNLNLNRTIYIVNSKYREDKDLTTIKNYLLSNTNK